MTGGVDGWWLRVYAVDGGCKCQLWVITAGGGGGWQMAAAGGGDNDIIYHSRIISQNSINHIKMYLHHNPRFSPRCEKQINNIPNLLKQ